MSKLKCIILLLTLCQNLYSGEIHILARLKPAGSLEISSDHLLGYLTKSGDIISSKKIFVKIDSLDSGVDLRNEHIHKYLSSDKYKKLSIIDVKIIKGQGRGKLTLNGIKKVIKFRVFKENEKYISIFKINRKSFKLPKASFLGISVDDILEVRVTFPLKSIIVENRK